jgi:hypothetical protein
MSPTTTQLRPRPSPSAGHRAVHHCPQAHSTSAAIHRIGLLVVHLPGLTDYQAVVWTAVLSLGGCASTAPALGTARPRRNAVVHCGGPLITAGAAPAAPIVGLRLHQVWATPGRARFPMNSAAISGYSLASEPASWTRQGQHRVPSSELVRPATVASHSCTLAHRHRHRSPTRLGSWSGPSLGRVRFPRTRPRCAGTRRSA